MRKHFLLTITFILTLNHVFGQTVTARQRLITFDPYKSEEVKPLKLKSYKVYRDTSLDKSYKFDIDGRLIETKWFDGMGCHLDSFFYFPNYTRLHKVYDNDGKLKMYNKYFDTKDKYTSETYQANPKTNKFELTQASEIRYKGARKVYHKTMEYNKTTYVQEIEYKDYKFYVENEWYYDYKKDSLVNVTFIRSHKDSSLFYRHTNEKFARMKVDTTNKDTTFYYSDNNKELAEYKENGKLVAQIYFDDYGNISGTVNYIYPDDKTVKQISRLYYAKTKEYSETTWVLHYNEAGLLVKTNDNVFHKYEFYWK